MQRRANRSSRGTCIARVRFLDPPSPNMSRVFWVRFPYCEKYQEALRSGYKNIKGDLYERETFNIFRDYPTY